ncbi:hypothetical protein GBAR_LOCUS17020 [Geodia barretti]|uniref:Uncharacterized protein n=1 Tax=Geodia barretti TaxID=519541 RepID=A0AA35WRE9_GEOBA|nr:hypothetical protein GBAR_LOCUS17020 [Geodia barretti]
MCAWGQPLPRATVSHKTRNLFRAHDLAQRSQVNSVLLWFSKQSSFTTCLPGSVADQMFCTPIHRIYYWFTFFELVLA